MKTHPGKSGHNIMKKNLFLAAATLFLLSSVPVIHADEKTVSVKTRENYIRESGRFYSKVRAKVFFNEKLQIIDTRGEWVHVQYRDIDGWIHKSAVYEAKKMKYRPVMLDSEIDPSENDEKDEVALAGKGFTPEVEKKMGENDPGLNYALVDEIVSRDIPPEKLNRFIKEGGLKFPE